MIGKHVRDRLAGRVAPDERATIERRIEDTLTRLHAQGETDAAVRVWRAASKRVSEDGSNGQCAVLLVRGGQGVTIMWRRVTQPHTAAAYGVRKVYCVKSTCSPDEHKGHR